MFTAKSARSILLKSSLAALLAATGITCSLAAPLNIRDVPLFLNDTPPPLNMLVLSRDHRLYYEAYNDTTDLDDDGTIDVGYKPRKIDYFGYFENDRCYTYDSGTGIFSPSGAAGADKTCSGQWSGDWLNYVTTSRIDALRKVLYGGMRYIDTASDTVLQRAYIPQDAHSWGKEYESVARDGYDISQYTPLSLPTAGTRHLFANTTLLNDGALTGFENPAINGVGPPKMRVLRNSTVRVWNWLSIERPVAGGQVVTGVNASGQEIRTNVTPEDFIVRVRVCGAGTYTEGKSSCRLYSNGNAKPTGLLQDYGENDQMYFGLLSGSYGKPHEGGVLRKAVSSVRGEMYLDSGRFRYGQSPRGIVATIDQLRITGFGGNYEYTQYSTCGWITDSSDANGRCAMWGNPTAEMMYEGLRYFAGEPAATSDFDSGANNQQEIDIGLTKATWDSNTNPYRAAGGFPSCSKPFQTVISDISPSFDSDKVPGSTFGSMTASLNGNPMNVATIGTKMWGKEIGGTHKYFIGESGSNRDRAPTVKEVSDFNNIRGLSPEAPTKEGSYNAGSVAYFGHQTDINAAKGNQKVQTFVVALASPLPSISIPVAGQTITLVPFAKSVGGSGIQPGSTQYQPTNQIVDFYVDTITDTYGKFRVNFEDVEQGADHDMDAIAVYEYKVNADDTVTVTVTSEYAAGGIIQHMGYVISGTDGANGTYLVVRDTDTASNGDVDYFLDTPPGQPPGGTWADGQPLPAGSANPVSRTFKPGAGSAEFLKDPLWYAAKWGGFTEPSTDKNDVPDKISEWAARNSLKDPKDPDPDNYFLVTNALRLREQLSRAFNDILDRAGSASSASVSSGSISDDTRIYQATFDARHWAGHLKAYKVGTGQSGTTEGVLGAEVWDAANKLPKHDDRRIISVKSPASASAADGIIRSSSGIPFRWSDLEDAQKLMLKNSGAESDTIAETRLNYLRGDSSAEAPDGALRTRGTSTEHTVLGDIVNSAPVFVGAPPWRYPDSLESAPYSSFVAANLNRQKAIYVGANDGMMHAFAADTGEELFAYVPYGVFRNLIRLTDPAYSHLFYVDGSPSVVDAYVNSAWRTMLVGGLNKGGQSIFALDVTDPGAVKEANAKTTVMWEFTDQADPDLGYTYSRPAVVKLQNGKWVAIFGNGYNSTVADGFASSTGNAILFVVDLSDGAVLAKLDTGQGTAADPKGEGRPNGLSTPVVIDKNGDGRSDTAYAGDLFGNLWKFDLSGSATSDWKVANGGAPLFVAMNGSSQRQPITERPQVGRGPNGQGWVILFGTGKFLESSDRELANLQVQSFYGIFDNATGTTADVVPNRSVLLQQTILKEGTVTVTEGGKTIVTPARATSNNARTTAHRGWYIDLVSPSGFQGEMQVTNPVLRNGRVVFTTLIPDSDICAYGGRSWLMDMDALSGSRLPYSPFDLNRDTEYDSDDFISDGTGSVPPSGRGADAILTAPAFLQGALSDYAVTTSSGSDSDSSTISIDRSNAGPAGRGRQSWRQLR